MKLIIGGYAQGKLNYVLSKYHLHEDMVWESDLPDITTLYHEDKNRMIIINHFHNWVKKQIRDNQCPGEEIFTFLEHCQNQLIDCIVICDEVGNGIVPIDPLERKYREHLGRILIQLADRAEEVERVLCGIGQKIK